MNLHELSWTRWRHRFNDGSLYIGFEADLPLDLIIDSGDMLVSWHGPACFFSSSMINRHDNSVSSPSIESLKQLSRVEPQWVDF